VGYGRLDTNCRELGIQYEGLGWIDLVSDCGSSGTFYHEDEPWSYLNIGNFIDQRISYQRLTHRSLRSENLSTLPEICIVNFDDSGNDVNERHGNLGL